MVLFCVLLLLRGSVRTHPVLSTFYVDLYEDSIDQTNFHVRKAKWNPETHVHTECAKHDDDNGNQFFLAILTLNELLQA